MSDKIKACCENCKGCSGRNACDDDYYFFMPSEKALNQRIAELEAENKELKAENKILLDDLSKVQADCFKCEHGDVRKLVKPLQWEYDEDDEIYSAPISPRCRKFLQVSVFCEKMKSGYWRVCTDCIVCDRKTPEEAKQSAQDWLVSLVANVCGLESEVQNG